MRDQFPFAVARVTRRWRKMLDERLKDLGVTQARWSTMVYLEKAVRASHSVSWQA